MRVGWSRNAIQRAANGRRILVAGEIAERNDAHQALGMTYHREPTHLVPAHTARDVLEILVVEALEYFAGHDLAHVRLRRLALRDPADGNIPIRDHAHQAIVLSDRQSADIDLAHQPRCLWSSRHNTHTATAMRPKLSTAPRRRKPIRF